MYKVSFFFSTRLLHLSIKTLTHSRKNNCGAYKKNEEKKTILLKRASRRRRRRQKLLTRFNINLGIFCTNNEEKREMN